MLEAIIARNPTEKTYVEDVFSTYLYTGNGAAQTINNDIGLKDTAAWNGYKLKLGAGVGYGIDVDTSGNFYITGTSNDGSQYLMVAKYNSSGVLQWQRKVIQGTTSTGRAIKVDSSGNVYVVGTVRVSTTPVIILLKYNSSGVLQWQRQLNQANSDGYGLSVAPSGNVYVSGYATGGTAWPYLILAKYNSSGAIQWQRSLSYGSTYVYGFSKMDIDSSENIYLTGYHNASGIRAIVAKYNSSGTIQWQRDFFQSGVSTIGNSTATDSSGNVYVVGYHNAAFLAKYNTSGALQWQRRFSSGAIADWQDICLDSIGNIYVCGVIDVGGGSVIGSVAKYNSSGVLQWQRTAKDVSARFYGIKVLNDNTIYVTGNGNDGANYVVTLVLKADGTTLSGTAFLTLSVGSATDADGTSTDGVNGATESAGGATDTAGGATDSAGAAITSIATQVAVTGAAGMVWIKNRSAAHNHRLFDTARTGVLSTNSINAEGAGYIPSYFDFTASGFTIPSTITSFINDNGSNYVAWTFRKKAKFFDVVTYTGNGIAGRTISHSLNQEPGMIIVKAIDSSDYNWQVYHRGSGANFYIELNQTTQAINESANTNKRWQGTTPSATTFTLGNSPSVNANGTTYIAYLFAHDTSADGLVQCGSFATDGSGNATINVGWEPQFILTKKINSTDSWRIWDTVRGFPARSSANQSTAIALQTNTNDAESVALNNPAYLESSSGFSILSFSPSSNYVYMAIRRGPMRRPTDATKFYSGTLITPAASSSVGFSPDLAIVKPKASGQNNSWFDRMRGPLNFLSSDSQSSETNAANSLTEIGQNGITLSSWYTGVGSTSVEHLRRAPGFFDIICYTGGSGSAITLNHNLGVTPELAIIKNRSRTSTNWFVGLFMQTSGGTRYAAYLQSNAARFVTGAFPSDPTSTTLSLGLGPDYNNFSFADNYVAYLFASCPGVSKVGTFTGNGAASQTIDCGFSNGARFVMIKRTDDVGDWYYWDSTRGIIAGNDPFLRFNSTGAEVTNSDDIDPTSVGFIVNKDQTAALNENGWQYIYLAIA